MSTERSNTHEERAMTEPLRISVEIARSFVDEYINEAYEEPVAAAIDVRVRPLVEALQAVSVSSRALGGARPEYAIPKSVLDSVDHAIASCMPWHTPDAALKDAGAE